MKDWRKAVKTPITYTVTNEVVRLQTTFVSVIAVLGMMVLLILYLMLPPKMQIHEDHLHTSSRLFACPKPFYNSTYPLSKVKVHGEDSASQYQVALIADLDTGSKLNNSTHWYSYLLLGTLTHYSEDDVVKLEWKESPIKLKSSLSANGRGMELSELVVFNGKLYSCDDRTGIVYEVMYNDRKIVPWVILNDGNGLSAKGFKCEWMTVKDEKLHVGGFGKEWTTTTGELVNFDPQWIKVIDVNGVVTHVDWRNKYLAIRSAVGIQFPGYLIHESAVYSSHHSKWYFLPRRASSTAYNEVEDERKGTNLFITADDSFTQVDVKTVGPVNPTHGFSSFKFIPGTSDTIIVAIKSMEDEGNIGTFYTVFTVDGKVLLPETKIESNVKYEGIEFV